jgi:hypothetical protein
MYSSIDGPFLFVLTEDEGERSVAVSLTGYMAAPLLADILEVGRAHQEPWMRISRSRCLAALQRSAQCLFDPVGEPLSY